MSAFEPRIDIEGLTSSAKTEDSHSLLASDYTNQPAEGAYWKMLKSKHSQYHSRALKYRKESLLFEGGFQMNEEAVAQLFCPKMRSEEDNTAYRERVKSAAYLPILSKLGSGLISTLFSQDLSVIEAADHDDPTTAGEEYTDDKRDYYKEFQDNCDGHGTSLHNFIKSVATCGQTHTFHWLGVDYIKGQAENLLEQEKQGLDVPRLYHIANETVFDWKFKEGSNQLEWIKLVSCLPHQLGPLDQPKEKYFVKTWELLLVEGQEVAVYKCYLSEELPVDKKPKDKDILKLIDEGTTSFPHIPIFYYCLEDGVAVISKIAPMAAEMFDRSTIENHWTNKACITIPVLYRGEFMPDGEGIPNPNSMDLNAGRHPRGKVNQKGVVELGDYQTDKFEIVEATATALSFIHSQNEALEEKMHSMVHSLAQSIKQNQSKSPTAAASKQEDRHAMEMLLSAIADSIYCLVEQIFNCIAESRGEDIVFDVKGLSTITQADRTELTLEAQLLNSVELPSLTAKKEYGYRIIAQLIEGTDQRTLATIRKEIQETYDQNPDTAKIDPAAKLAQETKAKEAKKPTTPKGSNPQSAQNPVNEIGDSGQAALSEGAHTQTGQHIEPQVVYDQLAEDYKPSDIQWVLSVSWIGPVELPLSSIDFSNKDNWQASSDQNHVDKFVDKISNQGFSKPIIVVNQPHNDNKAVILDGHHRALAYLDVGQNVLAYIGQVGTITKDMQRMHSTQAGSQQASKQRSMQKN